MIKIYIISRIYRKVKKAGKDDLKEKSLAILCMVRLAAHVLNHKGLSYFFYFLIAAIANQLYRESQFLHNCILDVLSLQ